MANKPFSTVHVFIIAPASYSGGVTVPQAMTAVQTWLGQPSDPPLIGSTSISMESWVRHETGKVFDYDITVHSSAHPDTDFTSSFDACGSMDGLQVETKLNLFMTDEVGYSYENNGQRTMIVLLGAGGWAGHKFISPRSSTTGWCLVGDWGVMEQDGAPNDCVTPGDFPTRGFGHEFMGMMGAFWTSGGGDTDDPIFTGDVLATSMKRNLIHNSGAWLRNP